MRDPYRFYARRILGLEPLEPLDADPGAADHGMLVHRALHDFVMRYPEGPPEDGLARLLAIGRELFARFAASPEVQALWWPRYESIARWFCDLERTRRAAARQVLAEVEGRLALPVGDQCFEIRARADRIEQRDPEGLVIVDYKTGTPPKKKEVVAGFAPQLPVQGLIARDGAFGGLSGPVVALEYWQLTGDEQGGACALSLDGLQSDDLLDAARSGLARLLAHFADANTAYVAIPRPELAARYNPYDHLTRRQEWWGRDTQD